MQTQRVKVYQLSQRRRQRFYFVAAQVQRSELTEISSLLGDECEVISTKVKHLQSERKFSESSEYKSVDYY